nr:uncharacterized protein LOC111416696 [Onthophagus taurus]
MADDQVKQVVSAFVVLAENLAIELLKPLQLGAYSSLVTDLCLQSGYENFVRMSHTEFEELLHLIAPLIIKNGRTRNDNVSPGEQLAVTLRFLATGDSYGSLMYHHRILKTKLSQIIPNVCKAIVQVLREEIKIPRNKET